MTNVALSTLNLAARSLARRVRDWGRECARWRWFWSSYRAYRQAAEREAPGAPGAALRPSPAHLWPCLTDATQHTPLEPIYFYQGAWAFERIIAQRPESHVDVASDAFFVALLSKVVPTTMVDIRPPALALQSLSFRKGSILDLPFETGSQQSVSSMCVVEHIGLGRYGDPIDPAGSEKAFAELKRIVRPGGHLFLSVPLDEENRVYFNAHRAFEEPYLLRLFEPFEVLDRQYIYGNRFGPEPGRGFGTGCYHLRRPQGAPGAS
jgi:SAM-dependent methyltransferase